METKPLLPVVKSGRLIPGPKDTLDPFRDISARRLKFSLLHRPDQNGGLCVAVCTCRRKIEMSPSVQSRNDTPGGGEDNRQDDIAFAMKSSNAFDGPKPDRLRSSVTGEAEAGSAGEQPVEE